MKYAVLTLGLFFSALSWATPWVSNEEHVAMFGYDPVAYFVEQQALRGRREYALQWDGVSWWFSSRVNRQRFQANPHKYAPQYGAHCANGLSDGHVVDANPENWRIIDGKLYLFYSAWGRAQWAFGVERQISQANQTWRAFLDGQSLAQQ